jgi:acetaldehyde dehydrogenase / alcohol dehydrogenase
MMEGNAVKDFCNDLLIRATKAASEFLAFDQERTDKIVTAVFHATFNARVKLARAAMEETGIGFLEHKIIKNSWASLRVFKDIISRKTVGCINEDPVRGICEIVSPIGPILALTPVTNPTSTIIFKTLIAMKTRNPIIFSPHRAARRCSAAAVEILREAVSSAGGPEDAIQILTKSDKSYLETIMQHRKIALILATGTPAVVSMAQSSGKPILGSGPGNVPVYVDKSADFELAAHYIVRSKNFDHGCVCSSEQSLVVTRETDKRLRPLLVKEGAYFCSEDEKIAVIRISYDPLQQQMRPAIVGQSAQRIAQMAGFSIPDDRLILMTECDGIGKEYPCSQEILAPILSYFVVNDETEALETVLTVEKQGGAGHTVSLFANDEKLIQRFACKTSAGRILINSPSTQGALGGLYNYITPSLTLSCGSESGTYTVDNISIGHLMHTRRLARRRLNYQWYSVPRQYWLDEDITAERILKAYDWNY